MHAYLHNSQLMKMCTILKYRRSQKNSSHLEWKVGLSDTILKGTHPGTIYAKFGSIGQAVSEEKIFRNRPIRNKNCLWWPCLLMDRGQNEQSL
jgi:hypothetical protein